MLFRKKNRPPSSVRQALAGQIPDGPAATGASDYIYIDYDMMVKGSPGMTNGKSVKRISIVVNGMIQLISTGDTVDRETFNALLEMGAVLPPSSSNAPPETEPEL